MEPTGGAVTTLFERVQEYERLLLLVELQNDHTTRQRMAYALGISLRSLYQKLEKHGLQNVTAVDARQMYLSRRDVAVIWGVAV